MAALDAELRVVCDARPDWVRGALGGCSSDFNELVEAALSLWVSHRAHITGSAVQPDDLLLARDQKRSLLRSYLERSAVDWLAEL